jgi:carbon storage regulator
MLVLSRKVGESVVIDGGIVVRVLSAEGGRIRLGVEAPAEVSVRRSELTPRPATSRFVVPRKYAPAVVVGAGG